MAIEDDDDRALFFDPEEFGVTVSYTKQGAAAVSLNGIFDREPVDLAIGADLSLDDAGPQILVREIDLPAGAGEGDAVTVTGQGSFLVKNIQPDGTGMAVVRLEVA